MLQGSSSGTGASPKTGFMRAGPWSGLGGQVNRGRDGAGIGIAGRTSRNRPAEGARGPTKRTGEVAPRRAKAGTGVWQRERQVPGRTAQWSFSPRSGNGSRRMGLEGSGMRCRYVAPRSSSGGCFWGCGLVSLHGWVDPPHHPAGSRILD